MSKPLDISINSVRSENLSLKYQGFFPLCLKDIGNGKSKFGAKTQFL